MENNIKPVCGIFLTGVQTQKILDIGEKKVSDMFSHIREEKPKKCSDKMGKRMRSILIAEYVVENQGFKEEDEEFKYEVEKLLAEMGVHYQMFYGEK